MHKFIENYCGTKIFYNYSGEQLNFFVKVHYPEMSWEISKIPDAPPDAIHVKIEPNNYFLTKIGILRTVKQSAALKELRELIEEHLYETDPRFLKLKCPQCDSNSIRFDQEREIIRRMEVSGKNTYSTYKPMLRFKPADCSNCGFGAKPIQIADGRYQCHPI